MNGFSEDPTTPYRARLDKASFFAWVRRQGTGRFELEDGEIVMHAATTRNHAKVSAQVLSAIARRLDLRNWTVTSADFAVEVGDTIRYPDVMLERAGLRGDAMATAEPVLLVEVLSASSAGRDLIVKLAEYTSLPSLDCYVVASQDDPILWGWTRDEETKRFPEKPIEITGLDANLSIASPRLELPLAEIYMGVTP